MIQFFILQRFVEFFGYGRQIKEEDKGKSYSTQGGHSKCVQNFNWKTR